MMSYWIRVGVNPITEEFIRTGYVMMEIKIRLMLPPAKEGQRL